LQKCIDKSLETRGLHFGNHRSKWIAKIGYNDAAVFYLLRLCVVLQYKSLVIASCNVAP